MNAAGKVVVGLLIAASFAPVWRSGLKRDMCFWAFVVNHTIFGDPVEYLPPEAYK